LGFTVLGFACLGFADSGFASSVVAGSGFANSGFLCFHEATLMAYPLDSKYSSTAPPK
jgi:hypothetical protein